MLGGIINSLYLLYARGCIQKGTQIYVTVLTLWVASPKNVLQLVQDLMVPKPVVELHTF